MPIYKSISSTFYTIVVWKISEDEDQLMAGINLHPTDQKKFSTFKNTARKCEFLALRHCLKEIFGENPPVYYHDSGKPYLRNGHQISFSHTKNFAAAIVCKKLNVGLDLECFRLGVQKISRKFIRPEEQQSIDPDEAIKHLTAYWSAKEVIVKIEGNRKLDFRAEIKVAPFHYHKRQTTVAVSKSNLNTGRYQLYFQEFPEFLLTFGWSKE